MIKKQIKQELLKARTVSLFLILFIALASALCANAVDLFYSLNQTMNQFYEASQTSHLLQMHSGDLDESVIAQYAKNSDLISQYEIVKMINVSADALTIRQDGVSELGSVTDNSFVVQNDKFDFLLDSENQIAKIEPGYIGVPVYYKILYGLREGDEITIETSNKRFSYIISDFIKDSEMNTSYISSKRFLTNKEDWKALSEEIDNIECMIEFLAEDVNMTNQLEVDYLNKGFTFKGPVITFSTIRLLNILTDVVTATVLILAAILLVFVSILCVRFAMVTSIDQEYMDIAVMKGLGIPAKYISDIFMKKYTIIALIGSVIGFVMSFGLVGAIQYNMSLYMGLADKTVINYSLQFISCVFIASIVLFFSKRAVNKTRKINVVEALQQKSKVSSDKVIRHPSIKGKGRKHTNFILGIKYILCYKKPYIIICCIFTVLMLLVLLPIQITTTMKSEEFSTYMGIAKCDLRIDFQDAQKAENDIQILEQTLADDADIEKYGLYETYLAYTNNQEGESVYLNFESGDYSDFGISCTEGNLPTTEKEIAISYLLAKEIQKTIGEKISIEVNSKFYDYTICGIYQDITNGGKSAKVSDKEIDAAVYRSVININLVNSEKKLMEITKLDNLVSNGKITDLQNYISQTMGASIEKFTMLSMIILIIAILITILTVSVFMKLLIIKYKEDISTMKRLGFRSSDIKLQYLIRIIMGVLVGSVLGEILVKIAGQSIVGSAMASMGASQIVFVTNIFLTYLLIPGVIIIVAVITTFMAGNMINRIKVLCEQEER